MRAIIYAILCTYAIKTRLYISNPKILKPTMNLDTAIRAVLASDKESASSGADVKILRKKLNKVVLAYSGGLDTSVIVPWLR